MQNTARHLIAAQLQTLIRTHLRLANVGVPELAAAMGLSEWAIEGMLRHERWELELCLELIDKLRIMVAVTEANPT